MIVMPSIGQLFKLVVMTKLCLKECLLVKGTDDVNPKHTSSAYALPIVSSDYMH